MTKPLKIAPWVVPEDLQAIYDYHRLLSVAKAERIIEEYDRVIALLEVNPLLFHARDNGWRVYPFEAATYLLYYKELEPSGWWPASFTPAAIPPGSASNCPPGPERPGFGFASRKPELQAQGRHDDRREPDEHPAPGGEVVAGKVAPLRHDAEESQAPAFSLGIHFPGLADTDDPDKDHDEKEWSHQRMSTLPSSRSSTWTTAPRIAPARALVIQVAFIFCRWFQFEHESDGSSYL